MTVNVEVAIDGGDYFTAGNFKRFRNTSGNTVVMDEFGTREITPEFLRQWHVFWFWTSRETPFQERMMGVRE